MIQKITTQAKQPAPEELHDFYTASFGKDGLKIRFDRLKIVNLLRGQGFFRYVPKDQSSNASEMVRIVDNKIRIVNNIDIIYAFEDYIMKLPPLPKTFYRKGQAEDEPSQVELSITADMLQSKLYDNLRNLSSDLMDMLRPTNRQINIQADDKDNKYIFFNNTALSIDKHGAHTISYNQLTDCIWESSIINRDYREDNRCGDFETFIGHICKYDPKTDANRDRKESLMSLLGYLMHDNYESNLKAVLFTDVNIDHAGEAAGGTGKGLIGKALEQMLSRSKADSRYLAVPGKGFEFKDTRYSRGSLNTQLIHIEDLDKRFKLEQLYNDITEGAMFRKLHHDPSIHRAKFMLSVNHTINLCGSSDKRRVVIFELHNYYSEIFTPEDEFKKRFFESDWTADDWNQFYTFMIRCIAVYMKRGLIEPQSINYENRLIQEQLPEDFVFFFESEIQMAVTQQIRMEFNKKNLWLNFCNCYSDYIKYGQSAFTKWCISYLEHKHIRSAHMRTTRNGVYADLLIINPGADEVVFKNIVK